MTDLFDTAPCRHTDPEVFFPEHSEDAPTALNICRECPLSTKRACAQLAVQTSAADGIWAGEYITRIAYRDHHIEARRRVEELAGITYRRRPTKRPPNPQSVRIKDLPVPECAHCRRTLVSRSKTVQEGERQYAAKGLCWGCYNHARNTVDQ